MKNNAALNRNQKLSNLNHYTVKKRDFEEQALPLLEELYGAASCLVQNDTEAQNLVQIAVCNAYKSWDQFRPWANCRVWLFGFLATAYIDQFRPFPRLTEAINSAYWPEGYHAVSLTAIQSRLDESGKTLPMSVNRAINIADETGEFQPWSRFARPESGSGSLSGRSLRLNIAFNNGGGHDESQPKRRSATWLRTNEFYETTHAEIDSSDVKRAIRALPDDVRLLVVLSLLAGFTYGEIAQVAGIHLETVRSKLPRGRKLFRESFATMWRTEEVRYMHRQSEEQ